MMIEEIVRNYLNTQLSVPVYVEEPETKPASYVVILRSSQYREDFIDHATVNTFSVSQSLYAAASLDKLVRSAMESIITVSSVSRCELNNNFNDTDTQTKVYQYRSEFDLVFYEV